MRLPKNKTKIVATIGPASEAPEVMERMILAGMNVARLNFSHGDFTGHRKVIENLRAAAQRAGRRVAIMADLPGPKIRIGQFSQRARRAQNPGTPSRLRPRRSRETQKRVSVTFERSA